MTNAPAPDPLALPPPLAPADIEPASAVLDRAFMDDPAFVWVFPDAAERAAKMPFLHEPLLRLDARHQRSYGFPGPDGAPLGAIAAWLPPGKSIGLLEVVGAHWRSPFRMGLAVTRRLLVCLQYMESARPRLLGTTPHYYLDQLAVEPRWQGRGVGRRVLRACLAALPDRERVPAFLYTTKPTNVRFYEAAGFRVADEAVLGGTDGFRIWSMLRDPSPS